MAARGRKRAKLEPSAMKLTDSVLTLVADILAQSADPSGSLVPKRTKMDYCSSKNTQNSFLCYY